MKTKLVAPDLARIGKSLLFIQSPEVPIDRLQLAARNIPYVDFLKEEGLNAYDLLRKDIIIMPAKTLDYLNKRFLETPKGE